MKWCRMNDICYRNHEKRARGKESNDYKHERANTVYNFDNKLFLVRSLCISHKFDSPASLIVDVLMTQKRAMYTQISTYVVNFER